MSEVQKPVEEPVVAAPATETPAVEPTPTEIKAEEKPVVEAASTDAPVVTSSEATKETTQLEAKDETKPVEEGTLGYKAPGLIKSFIFSKKFFWFQKDPVESKNLASYLRGEKPEQGNHNAGWASHTGEGLLFFSKKSSEKANPAGIINLASVSSEVTPEGPNEFHFTLDGHKHTFQTNTAPERDSWVSVLKVKVTEAKGLADSITSHETYKKTHDLLSKPIGGGAVAVAPKKSEEKKVEKEIKKVENKTEKVEDKAISTAIKKEEKQEKKEEKAEAKADKKEDKAIATANKKEDKAEKKEDKVESKEEKKEEKAGTARKSRSQSRKRASIFGAIPGFGGKKEEKSDVKEEKKEEKAGEIPATTSEATAPAEELKKEDLAVPTTEEPTSATDRPTPAKRSSIFGTLQSRFAPKKEQKSYESESAPAVPAKDVPAEPVSETAPVIPAVETTEPLATSVASPATVPTNTTGETPVSNGDSKVTDKEAVKNDKRKSSLPWLSKKEKSSTSDEEGEDKPMSPFAKLRATVKGRAAPKAGEKREEKSEAVKEEKAVEPSQPAVDKTEEKPDTEATPVVSEPTTSEPVATAPTSIPQVSATA